MKHKLRALLSLIIILYLCGCSSNNAIQEPIQPTTYVYTSTYSTTTNAPTTSIVASTATPTVVTLPTMTATDAPMPITSDVEYISEAPTELEVYDALLIRSRVIPLTFADVRQSVIDNNDVVYPTGYVINDDTEYEYVAPPETVYPNTVLFGHNYRSFSILHTLAAGETFTIDVHGQRTVYEIQRSEEAYINAEYTDLYFYSDNLNMLYEQFDYHALIMVTCYNSGRWVVVAKPI